MKTALQKSGVPVSHLFTIRRLKQKHFDPTWHAHSEFQLFVVLKGTGTRFIGDSLKTFRPGEVVFTGPHLPHLWRSDEVYFKKESNLTTEGIVIYFSEHFLGGNVMEKEEMIMLRKLFTKSMRGLEFYGQSKLLALSMMHRLLEQQGLAGLILLLQLLDLLAGSKEYHYISSKSYGQPFNESETGRLNIVYEYVLKNFRHKILLEELAALLHMTPTSFSRYFTMKNSKPFSKFVSEIRIKHACTLLTETNTSIEEICYECGFNTPSNFNKQFKDIMLKKPTEYKKEFLSL